MSSYSESCTDIIKWLGPSGGKSWHTDTRCVMPNCRRRSIDLAAARLQRVSMKMMQRYARKTKLNGEHALSDVDLTVYDGVHVVNGRNGHAGGMEWGVEMGRARMVQGGRFNERSVVVLKEVEKGELIAIRSRGIQKKTNGPTGNTFPAIRFPSRFPRSYLSPYHSHWGTSVCPTRFNRSSP